MRIYLAGPDVFLPDPIARGEAMKRICASYGLIGIFPLDPVSDAPSEWCLLPPWRRIALSNEAHIRRCDALIANLTPFRGPSADPGTVFELGFMRALGRPVYGWTNDPRRFLQRTCEALDPPASQDARGDWRDRNGMALESCGRVDNLMIDAAVTHAGGAIILGDPAQDEVWTDLTSFRRCVAELAADCGGLRTQTVQS